MENREFHLEYRVVKEILSLQYLIETNRSQLLVDSNVLSEINLSLIQLLKKFTESLYKPSESSNALITRIRTCIQSLTILFNKVLERVTNYFGDFNKEIYFIDIKYLQSCLKVVTESAVEECDEIIYVERLSEHVSNHKPSSQLLLLLLIVKNPLLLHFWLSKFSSETFIAWNTFIQAFEEDYTCQNTDTLDRFHTLINAIKLPEGIIMDDNNVHIYQLDQIMKGYHSLFDAYQSKCDSGHMVIISGSFSDGEIEYPSLTIVRELLGLYIEIISCGDQHACVITNQGHLYTWGRGVFGRLGHGNDTDQKHPKLVEMTKEVPMKHVGCGFAFTGAVSREGKLYTWGAGMNGRLGSGNESNRFKPGLVEGLEEEIVQSK
jgi:hypothetical protein